jgi:hypothetical protein
VVGEGLFCLRWRAAATSRERVLATFYERTKVYACGVQVRRGCSRVLVHALSHSVRSLGLGLNRFILQVGVPAMQNLAIVSAHHSHLQ